MDARPSAHDDGGVKTRPTNALLACLLCGALVACDDGAADPDADESVRGAPPQVEPQRDLPDVPDFEGEALAPEQDELLSRMSEVEQLIDAGLYAEAADDLVWLWDNIEAIDPSMADSRATMLAGPIGIVAEKHPPSIEKFEVLRDALEAQMDQDLGGRETAYEWLLLNEALNHNQRVVEWFDRVKDDPDSRETLQRLVYSLEPFLVEAERWAELGELYPEALDTRLRMKARLLENAGDFGGPPEFVDIQRDEMLEQASAKYTALLAAGRDDEALEVLGFAGNALGGEGEMSVVEFALDRGFASRHQLDVIDNAGPDTERGRALRERVRRLLKD